MKNLYVNKINTKLNYLVVILAILFGMNTNVNAQVKKAFTQRTSQYTPTKKIYNVKGDFTMLGNTCLTPQNYGPNTNNNGQYMTYVDVDGDPNTFNSSSSTLVLSNENGAIPSCSNIVYAGLYWTGKSSANSTFNVTKQVPNGTQSIDNDLEVIHNENIENTNYTLSITRGGSSGSRYPIYTFSGNGNTYAFTFYNSSAPNRVTLSVNGGTATNIPVTVNGSGTTATLSTPYTINDGTVVIKVEELIRSASTNLSTTDTQNTSSAEVNVSGTIIAYTSVTKTFNKRVVSLKGPAASGYTQITAAANDIYYPSGSDDDIYSAYAEITDYVRTNGIGQYTVADMALLEGNVGGTGYSGGWGMIVIYENSKMKWRDITIFDGYAYVVSTNTSGYDLPVSGFNTVQTGNVGMKLGLMASEGDVSFTGDYFRIRNLNTTNYTSLSHSGNSTSNFFNSSINAGGTRNPNLSNNTGIDIALIDVPNTGNTVIGNNQTSTNFRYGTSGDTYSIFAIAMSVDAYVPEVEGVITATTINGSPATQPYTILPGQEAGFSVDIKNIGTEAINNYKLIVPIPYNASYVPGSATGTIFSPQTTPTPNNISFNPSLGATGSLVWDFGTLVLPPNTNTVLARLTFKLTATSDCSILSNASCAGLIPVNGYSTGIGSNTLVSLNNANFIQGYTSNGSCIGEPIPAPINLTIDGSSYVSQNCSGNNIIRNFTYCSENTTVGTSDIASNFPPGSLFYNEYPVTINSIQYSDANPIPLIAGSTVTYYAVPAGGGSGCNFPFTISKCPPVIAQDDTLNGGNGTTGNPNIGNVLVNNGNGNDTVNGNPATTSQVTISIVTPATPIGGNPVPVINTTTGQVSVPPGTPAGTYTIVYQICDINNISNCDSATVTITVIKPIIDAVDDNGTPIVGASGGQTVANVLVNDTLNGNPATLANVILTQVSTTNPNVTLNPATGAVNVAPGTPAGTYTVTYQICEILNPTNCDTAIVTVNVTGAPIDAVDDNGAPVVGASGGQTVANVLVNDTLNGNPATLANVILTQVSTTNPNVTLNPATGAVNVAPGTPAGTYTVTYQICEILNPTNCDTAIVTVNVTGAPIDAVDDNGTPIVGASGGQTVANVLVNDTLNGNPATLSNVILTQVSTTNPNVTLNPATGAVNVAPGTPAGTYTVTYQICEILNPTNCDTAIVTVNVTGAPIDAVDDNYNNVLCTATGTIGNILQNDTLNGNPATLSNVTLSILSGNNPNVSINNSGDIIVAQSSSCGNYTFTYQICEILNPNNCDTATVSVTISDNDAPTWTTVSGSLDVTLECGDTSGLAAAQALFPVASDLCDNDVTNIVKTEGQFVASTTCANSGTYTNTWTVTDACGNISDSFTQTIRIQDTLAPVAPEAPATVTVACAGEVPAMVALTAQDNCNGAITVQGVDSIAQGDCANSFVVTRTWTFVDACGNTSSVSQTINVNDNVAPVAPEAPATVTVACAGEVPAMVALTAQDNCNGAITVQGVDSIAQGDCANSFVVTRTWTFVDACGNTSSVSQTINVNDNVAPVAPEAPATVTVACAGEVPAMVALTAQDNCNGAITVQGVDSIAQGDCANSFVVTRTWTFVDACGNTSSVSQTINVNDNVAPVAPEAPATVTVACAGEVPAMVALTAQDNCNGAITVQGVDSIAQGDCANSFVVTRTWTFVDACGNTSSVSQTINVNDNVAPVAPEAPATVTVACAGEVPAMVALTAQDNCNGAITVQGVDSIAQGDCANSFVVTRTWTFVDACGNTSSVSQTINVNDNVAPVAPEAPATITVACAGEVPAMVALTAQDNCNGAITVQGVDSIAQGDCANSFVVTRTWTFVDACGNTSSVSQTINVNDNVAPVAPEAPATITVACAGEVPAMVALTAQDNCNGAITVQGVDSIAQGDCANSFVVTRTWTFVDACGNTSSVSQTINVNDNVAPVAPEAPATITVACAGEVPAMVALTAQDNCNGAITVQGVDSIAQGDCANSFVVTRTWTFVDACGNTSSVSQTINVNDNVAPVAPEAPATITVACAGEVPAMVALTAQDNCNGAITVQGVDSIAQGDCANSFVVTRTWTFVDACGNTSSVSQTINVNDNVAPVAPEAPATITVACAGEVPAMVALTAQDNCNGAITVQGVDSIAQGDCANSFVVTRTWTFVDACGNTSSVSQTINVNDNVAPVAPEAPATVTVACAGEVPAMVALTAQDNCNGAITVQGVDSIAQGDCANSFVVTRTWTFVDACGNTSSVSQTINVNDNVAPVAPEAPATVTVACAGEVPAMVALTAQDNCNGAITVQGVDSIAQGDCANSFVVTRTWTFVDACGNTSSVSQTINVNDNVAPTINTQASNIVVECDGHGNQSALMNWLQSNGGATASDNCSNVTWSNNFDAMSNDCSAAVTVVFTATDACGNVATTTATFTINDTQNPVAPEAPATISVACTSEIPAMVALTATDNCSNTITVQGVDSITQGDCANSFVVTRTWTFVDACGNTSSVSQTINVNDNVAPVAPEAPATVTVACAGEVPAMVALTAQDNCNGAITVQGVDTITQGDCANSFVVTRTWTFVDACGNTSSVSQTINVNDNVAPVAPEAPATVTVACAGEVPAMVALTAQDNCNGAITVQGVDSIAQGDCANSFVVTRTWTFVDACGNTSSVSQTINVNDNVAPVAPEAPATVTVACAGEVPAMVALTAQDNCNGAITVQGVDSIAQGDCANSFVVTRTWTFVDACGNTSSVSQTINVNDNVAPVAPEAPATVTVACAGEVPAMVALTAQDNCNGAITVQGVDSIAQGDCANSFVVTRTWTFVDACGNTSSVSQTINVNDNVAPVAPEAPATVTVACAGEVPAMVALTAQDNCNGAITVQGVDSIAQGDCANSFVVTRTWTFVDACGNTSSVSQTINVNDNVAPVAPEAPATVTVACAGEVPAMVALTAQDNCNGAITVQGVDSIAQGDCANSFVVTRTWTFVDACGNTSSVSQTINVNDNVAPVAPEAPATITVACAGEVPAMVALTAQDNCNGAITVQGVDSIAQGDCANSFVVTRTWTFVDACGNTSSVSQTINVNDNVAPVAPEAPATINVACTSEIPAMVALTATDNCSNTITVQGVDSIAQGDCANSFVVTRTWTFVDACGNTSSVSQTINVNDNVAPVAPEAPATITVACAGEVPAMVALTAQDNCNGAITVQGVDSIAQGDCANSFVVTRTWTFVDACGNTSSVSQTINVNDNVAPVAPEAPATVTVACAGEVPAMVALTAQDNCNGAITAQGVDSIAQGDCANSFVVTRTWTFVDACGNTSSVSQTINVNDNVAPVAPEAPATITVACAGEVPAMVALTAQDNCNGAITVQGVDSIAQGDCANSFVVTRTWTFVDACGNTSSVSQTINVNDNVAPVAPEAPATITVACAGEVPAMVALTAQDNCNGAITVQGVDSIAQGDCANSFVVTRTWTFVDACGNTSSVSQTINVNDNVAPTFNEATPANAAASCDNVPEPANMTASDNCGTATVTMTETVIQGNCPSNYQIVRTWTATDACGNTSAVSQTITVTDTTGPVAVDTPLVVKVDATCDNIPGVPTLVFTDNCSGTVTTPEPTVTTSSVVDGVYTITRTWVATDACGNLSQTYTQYVYVTQVDEVIQLNAVGCNAAEFDTIDLNSLLPQGTTGGQWVDVNGIGGLTGSIFNAWQLPLGVHTYSYTINDGGCPRRYDVLIEVNDDCAVLACQNIVIHNAFSPNGDSFNEYFNIENIEDVACYPTNNVQIYNRWGVLVYETKNYDNNTRRFEGISEGRATVSKSEELPTGTYFYIIEWTTSTGERIVKDGYLYLTR